VTLGDDHDRRDLAKLVPQYGVHRAYMVDGKLVDTPPTPSADTPKDSATVDSAAQVPKQKSARKMLKKEQPAEAAESGAKQHRKHKKNRVRDRRNKGKHKKLP
ncbi:MAG TPA: helicase, partial [Lactobacillus sp.]|nr:helicase [Lactobacillus sp.]